eukprot:2055979-Pyramimonas_sp.AAC.1
MVASVRSLQSSNTYARAPSDTLRLGHEGALNSHPPVVGSKAAIKGTGYERHRLLKAPAIKGTGY